MMKNVGFLFRESLNVPYIYKEYENISDLQ